MNKFQHIKDGEKTYIANQVKNTYWMIFQVFYLWNS